MLLGSFYKMVIFDPTIIVSIYNDAITLYFGLWAMYQVRAQ
jgi:hypothetical protein